MCTSMEVKEAYVPVPVDIKKNPSLRSLKARYEERISNKNNAPKDGTYEVTTDALGVPLISSTPCDEKEALPPLYYKRLRNLAKLIFLLASLILFGLSLFDLFEIITYKSDSHRWILSILVLLSISIGSFVTGLLYDIYGWVIPFFASCSLMLCGILVVIILVSVAPNGTPNIATLSLFRFIAGLGVGGAYVLSSSLAKISAYALIPPSESPFSDFDKQKRVIMALSWTFFMQVNGQFLAVTLLTITSFIVYSAASDPGSAYNILHSILFGIVVVVSFGFIMWYAAMAWSMEKTNITTQRKCCNHSIRKITRTHLIIRLREIWTEIRKSRRSLFGASLTWFLFDFFFYGNQSFGDLILHQGLFFDATDKNILNVEELIIALLTYPGYAIGIAFLCYVDRKKLQLVGFAALSVLFFLNIFFERFIFDKTASQVCASSNYTIMHQCIHWNFSDATPRAPDGKECHKICCEELNCSTTCACHKTAGEGAQFAIAILIYTVINIGPNLCTYIISADQAPERAQGTYFSIAATCAKLGAMLGTIVKSGIPSPVYDAIASCIMCIVGCVITNFFVKKLSDVFVGDHQHCDKVDVQGTKAEKSFIVSNIQDEDLYIPRDNLIFGKYLARGGQGQIYRGTYQGQAVVLKEIYETMIADDIEPFIQEARMMIKLNNPYVVRFYGICMTKGEVSIGWNMYLVSQYHEGGTIKDAINSDTCSQRHMVRFAIQISDAFDNLHSRKNPIVHLDIKPENVLLDTHDYENAFVKICDWGVSKISKRNNKVTNQLVGTVAYMAPEVLDGQQAYIDGCKVDVFAGGIMFGYMFSRREPWLQQDNPPLNEFSIMKSIVEGKIPQFSNNTVPIALQKILQSMLNYSPEARANYRDVKASLRVYRDASC